MSLKSNIIDKGHAFGFEAVYFAKPELPEEAASNLQEFIAQDYHGTMDWLADRQEIRSNPKAIMPDIRTAIVVGMNYGPEHNPLDDLHKKHMGNISVYARNKDYHDLMKGRLKQLAGYVASQGQGDVKVFVDTAPVMEKVLAAQSGMGWAGKHTCVVSREFGSWLFLGVIYTTVELEVDTPEKDHCGSCSSCLDICPTQAFVSPRKMDARRCISYLTIEHKGQIGVEFRKKMGNRIYGCDDCLAVCPWNKFAQEAANIDLQARGELQEPRLSYLLTLDDASFRIMFRKSPVKRIGRDRFIRNTLVAAGNSGDTNLLPQIQVLLGDESPLVRGMAVWALRQLASNAYIDRAKLRYAAQEKDVTVLAEWNALEG